MLGVLSLKETLDFAIQPAWYVNGAKHVRLKLVLMRYNTSQNLKFIFDVVEVHGMY